MDWASAAIGLGGIVVAAMGLLFTYRTRLSPYQQSLYELELHAASSVLSRPWAVTTTRSGDFSLGLARGRGHLGRPRPVHRRRLRGVLRGVSAVEHHPSSSVTESINAYLEVLRGLGEHSEARIRDASRGNDDPGTRLAAAYSVVVSAARQGLRTKALSDRALGSLGSQNLAPETGPAIDPLLVKGARREPGVRKLRRREPPDIPASASGSASPTCIRKRNRSACGYGTAGLSRCRMSWDSS